MEKYLTKEFLTRYTPEEVKLVRLALDLAKEAHLTQKRKSGEDYITHPIEVAKLLYIIGLDAPTVVASILHDLPEDTSVNIQQIQKQFGKEIAHLVNGVTKLSSVRLKTKWFGLKADKLEKMPAFERQVNTLRKMFLATGKDIRVVIIKLADRLHNMRTLNFLPAEKQTRIARETLEIYAPLADRLGIGKWKTELENLSFPYVYPEESKEINKIVSKNSLRKERDLERVKEKIYRVLAKRKIKPIEIQSRIKHGYSLWRKLNRYHQDISKIYDLLGIRVIVANEQECYEVMSAIHNHFKPIPNRIKDYMAAPKPNGYRTLHTTVIGPNKQAIEIQIRGKKMHQEAERGITAHWYYDEGKKKVSRFRLSRKTNIPVPKEQLAWITELGRWQASVSDPTEFSQSLKFDFFKDRIFVFTPQGDVKELPQDATPIDFAFSIHSQVGYSCVGAKVNGKIVPLGHKLRNGDVVEIMTSKKPHTPKRDWLNQAKSRLAKSLIRRSIRKPLDPTR